MFVTRANNFRLHRFIAKAWPSTDCQAFLRPGFSRWVQYWLSLAKPAVRQHRDLSPLQLALIFSTRNGLLLMKSGIPPAQRHNLVSMSKSQKSQSQADANNLDSVWRQFGDQFRRRARTRLRQYGLTGQAESMDICNDVMVDLAKRQEAEGNNQPLTPDDVLGYVMRAIDNQVVDTFRTLARQCRDFRRNDTTPVDDMPVMMQATTPSQVALRQEILTRVRAVLGDDAVIVDMVLENRDWQEIGAAIGIQPDTARMRMRRALDRVKRDLGIAADKD